MKYTVHLTVPVAVCLKEIEAASQEEAAAEATNRVWGRFRAFDVRLDLPGFEYLELEQGDSPLRALVDEDDDPEHERSGDYDCVQQLNADRSSMEDRWVRRDPRTALAAPVAKLLQAARCALADLEGIMPEFEASGEQTHPAWETIKELRAAVAGFEGK